MSSSQSQAAVAAGLQSFAATANDGSAVQFYEMKPVAAAAGDMEDNISLFSFTLECDDVAELFDPVADILDFVEHQQSRKTFTCFHCKKNLTHKRSLVRHVNMHTSRFECALCGTRCTSRTILHRHLLSHRFRGAKIDVPAEITPETHTPCKVCAKYVRKAFLKYHYRRSHSEAEFERLEKVMEQPGRIYRCDKCSKVYENYSSFSTHRNTHSDKFRCFVCGKGCSSLVHLRIHFRVHQKSARKDLSAEEMKMDESYKWCEVCSRFIKKFRWERHERTIHNKQFPTCELCSKTFQNRAHIERHMASHTGLCKYKCHICNKRYKQKVTLEDHIRTFHLDEAHIYCKVCHKSFISRSSLYVHRVKWHNWPKKRVKTQ